MTHWCVWHDSFMCVTWLIDVCDTTHSCVWHDSFVAHAFICVTWLIHTCDMTHSYVWHDSFNKHKDAMFCTASYASTPPCSAHVLHCTTRRMPCCALQNKASLCLYDIASLFLYEWVMSHTSMSHVTHTSMSHVTHMNELCHTCRWDAEHAIGAFYGLAACVHMDESCHIYERVMLRVWTSHVTHLD